jgi:two-component system cell cycle sensor histidine kinase/response regulator CckA
MAINLDSPATLAQDLLDRLDECILTLGADWRILAANPAAARLLRSNALAGRDARQVVPDAVRLPIDLAMAERNRTECTDWDAPGSRWLECRAFPAAAGGLHVVIRDVTGRHAAQHAVATSERELRRLADSGIVGIHYWDIEGPIIGANDMFLRTIGYTRADLEAGGISWRAITPPEYQARDAAKVAELLERGMHLPYEKEYIRKDSTRVPVLVASAFFLGSDRRGISICVDLTERRLTEAERDAACALFDRFVDASPVGFALFDRDLRCLRVNRAGAKGVGQSPEAPVGLRMRDVIPPIARQAEPLMQHVLDSGEAIEDFEIVGKAPGAPGKRVWITTYFPVRDPSGTVMAVGTTAIDVTGRRRTEEALRESERLAAIGQLAGGVAHEVNNALQGVLGFADFALRDEQLTPETRDDVEQIRKAAERAASITRQLLAFGRRQVRDPVRLDVRQLLLDFAPMLRQALGPDRELALELPDGDVHSAWLLADRGQLEQVLLNLTLNARDATQPGSRMTWRVAGEVLDPAALESLGRTDLHPGGYVRLEAIDAGVGMDEETRTRVFEPFFTTKPVGKGTGLGLSVAYGIVRQNGGHIAVRSAPGRGTTVTLLMPEVPSRSTRRAPPPVTPARELPSGARVLVVDNDPSVLALLERMLRSLRFEVTTAPNGRDAIAALETGSFDLVVTDVAMPEMDGLAVARAAERRGDVPVLFVTGCSPEELAQRGLARTAAVIQKPFTPVDFTSALLPLIAAAGRQSETGPEGPV